MVKFYQKRLHQNAILKKLIIICLVKDMENINKEEFFEYLLQGRERRLDELKENIYVYKTSGFNIGQSDIWSDVSNWLQSKNSSNNAAQKIYEEKFLQVFNDLLKSVDLDDFLKSKGYNAQEKPILESLLRLQLLSQPIAIMLNDHLKTS